MKHLHNNIVLNQYDQYRGMRCYLIDTNTVLLPVGYCETHGFTLGDKREPNAGISAVRAETRFFIR